MELDPEKNLWLPNRRSFFFFGAAAGVGVLLPDIVEPSVFEGAQFSRMEPIINARGRFKDWDYLTELWNTKTGEVTLFRNADNQILKTWNYKEAYGHDAPPFVRISPVQLPHSRPSRMGESPAGSLRLVE